VSKQSFEKQLEELGALRAEPGSAATLAAVRKALRDRNNYLVSKAAALAADLSLSDLISDLLAAFDRFLLDPLKTDPQCWAKTAIAKALKDLGHRDAKVYLRGILHIQLEPGWGGSADSAGTLRGTCALALVDCQLDDLEILGYLVYGLADLQKPVRVDAATAIAQLGRMEGSLLLRLKLLLGDGEPEVMGACFSSLQSLTPQDAVPFIGKFLKGLDDEIRLEAAAALAQSREPEAIGILKNFWRERLSRELRGALVAALGGSPLHEAAEFLISIVDEESDDLAAGAVAALAASRFRAEMRDRIAAIVEGKENPGLTGIFEQKFAVE
jgi:hypothetical protein